MQPVRAILAAKSGKYRSTKNSTPRVLEPGRRVHQAASGVQFPSRKRTEIRQSPGRGPFRPGPSGHQLAATQIAPARPRCPTLLWDITITAPRAALAHENGLTAAAHPWGCPPPGGGCASLRGDAVDTRGDARRRRRHAIETVVDESSIPAQVRAHARQEAPPLRPRPRHEEQAQDPRGTGALSQDATRVTRQKAQAQLTRSLGCAGVLAHIRTQSITLTRYFQIPPDDTKRSSRHEAPISSVLNRVY